MDITPNQTLYINNINEKVKLDVLKKLFIMVFSQYGKVVEIKANSGLKLRGQAWIVFEDISSATNALRGKQGFNFYGKPLKIQYAKTKSNIISNKELQEEGTIGKKRKNNNNDRDDGNELRSRKEENDEDNNNIQLQTSHQHILVAKDLPLNITQDALTILFQQCRGFKEVRKPDGRNIAFIEFYDPIEASMALKQFNGFILNSTTNETLLLSFSQ